MSLAYILKAVVNFMLAIVGILLGLRFLLKLFGANAGNGFVEWVYESSGEILGPFRGIFPAPNIDGFIIEFSTIFALIIYGLIGMLAFYLIDLMALPAESERRRK